MFLLFRFHEESETFARMGWRAVGSPPIPLNMSLRRSAQRELSAHNVVRKVSSLRKPRGPQMCQLFVGCVPTKRPATFQPVFLDQTIVATVAGTVVVTREHLVVTVAGTIVVTENSGHDH